ncbi:hypothetical protein M9H77_21539 [Catharanthus roseus]|uniref:Uncharacterized protein n=1 Tax=Catharanthus roseus TaxID=4058 RepID=A0ACC0ANC2_CATRO|nr:hypothetical protein M9H77_21539 [Catharanthus roseus]
MYEVTQNVDLSSKVDALSKKFDKLLALNTLPTNSPDVQGVCAICSSPSHNLCRNKSMQLKNFTGKMTHIQTCTIQAAEIILISPGGSKEGKVNYANININKTNNLV